MKPIHIIKAIFTIFILLIIAQSCNNHHKKRIPENFTYNIFKDSIKASIHDSSGDESNIFDSTLFTPGVDSVNTLLVKMDSLWHRNINLSETVDTLLNIWKKEDKYSPDELSLIKENVQVLDSFLANRNAKEIITCREKECLLFAEIIKSTQTLYLYLDGELIDSFAVSTGIKKYETPDMSRRPSGPIFTRYTSKKFPGGNYKGLGNMPYAVFILGGYAIHGTTPGNFAKLGSPASHGCIRLHPVNARIFYELVKLMGLNNTWITIKD